MHTIKKCYLLFFACIIQLSCINASEEPVQKKYKIYHNKAINTLYDSIGSNDFEKMNQVVDVYKQDITEEFQGYLDKKQYSFTPLHLALKRSSINKEILKTLCTFTPMLKLKEKRYKEAPLLFYLNSDKKKNVDIVKLLVEAGSDVQEINIHGNTCMHIAVWQGLKDIIAYLCEKNAAMVNIASREGKTPIAKAIYENNFEITQLLLENGANFSGKNDEICLLSALKHNNNYKLIELLLDYNVPSQILNTQAAYNTLNSLLVRGRIDILQLLLSRNVLSPNSITQTSQGIKRPLYHVFLRMARTAHSNSHNKLPSSLCLKGLDMLEQYGADFTLPDDEGYSFNDLKEKLDLKSETQLSDVLRNYDEYLQEDVKWIINILQQKENSQMDPNHLWEIIAFLIGELKSKKDKTLEDYIWELVNDRSKKLPMLQKYAPENQEDTVERVYSWCMPLYYYLKEAIKATSKLNQNQKNELLSL